MQLFFLNLRNQDFAEGKGPYQPVSSAGAIKVVQAIVWIMLAVAIGLAIATYAVFHGDLFYLGAAAVFVVFAGGIHLITNLLRKTHAAQIRLSQFGKILPAELIEAKEDNSDSPTDIICKYRFTSPSGAVVTGRDSGLRRDLDKKNLPPPGTPMLVIYVDDQLYQAL